MKRSLTAKETVTITSMLFGMFFGAGNLIFPAKMGVDAGSNLLSGFLGVFITAVGIPMLAVVALGLSRCEGVVPLANKVGKKYSIFFCSLLYLTIGRCLPFPGAPALLSPWVQSVCWEMVITACIWLFSPSCFSPLCCCSP